MFLAIILLFLTSCKPTELSDCEAMEDAPKANECISDIIGGKKDTTQCDAMDEGRLKNNCYSIVARNLGDASICDKNFPKENIPKVGCYITVAIKTKNPDICAGIRDNSLGARCYSSLASSQKDIGVCNYIKDTQGKNDCLTRVNFELGNCEALRDIASKGIYEDCKRMR